jgi:hypothetical protein
MLRDKVRLNQVAAGKKPQDNGSGGCEEELVRMNEQQQDPTACLIEENRIAGNSPTSAGAFRGPWRTSRTLFALPRYQEWSRTAIRRKPGRQMAGRTTLGKGESGAQERGFHIAVAVAQGKKLFPAFEEGLHDVHV